VIVLFVNTVVVSENHHEVYVFWPRVKRVARCVNHSDVVVSLDQHLLEIAEVNRRVVLKNESSFPHESIPLLKMEAATSLEAVSPNPRMCT
jgi:hypothetical protein